MLYFYTGSKQKHAFTFPPNKYSMFASIIFLHHYHNEAWAIVLKKRKKCGHMKAHKKCEDPFWSIVEQKKLALSQIKDGEKNHCFGVIMIIPFPHTCTP